MRFDKLLVAAAVAVTGVSALPTANPAAEADAVAGPVQALTARNLALHSRSPVVKNKRTGDSKDSSKNSKSSKKSKSSKSSKSKDGYYKRIRSTSPTSRALKRSVWKYFKVRSAAPEPTGDDSASKSSKSSKSSKKSGKSSNDGKDHYHRRHLVVRNPEANSNDVVRRWLGLAPRDAEATEYPPPKSDSSKSGKSSKSTKTRRSTGSSKTGKSSKSSKTRRSTGSSKTGKSSKSSKTRRSTGSSKSGKSKESGKGYYVRRRLA